MAKPSPHGNPPPDPAALSPQVEGTDPGEEGEEEHEDPLREEQRLGSTKRGTAANDALRSLSRAARSFLIYDTHNEAIRTFLKAYKEDTEAALALGALDLEIRPFEMVLDGEIVYLERDRSRSLAFRMFRDGVRRLTIQPDVSWEELLRLLQILSIRYTGVRQHEDDIVTLLWKAGFQHIAIVAVEGFVADEEELGDPDQRRRRRKERAAEQGGGHVEVPADWDLPAPELPEEGVPIGYFALDEVRVSAVRAEVASMNLPEHALHLVRRMLDAAADPVETITLPEVAPLVGEVRDFLLSEGQLERLLELVQLIGSHRALDADWVSAQIDAATGVRAMRRILHTLPKGIQEAPEEMVELVRLSGREPIGVMVEALGAESTPRTRRVARDLLSRFVVDHLDLVNEAMGTAPADIAAVLFTAVVDADPALALPLVGVAQSRAERELELELFRYAQRPEAAPQRRALLEALITSSAMQVRLDSIHMLADDGDVRAVPLFLRRLEEEGETLSEAEAIALGEALVTLGGDRVLPRILGWVKPKGLRDMVGGVTLAGRMRQWAGVAGLGLSDREEAEGVIRWLSKRVDHDMHAHCMRTLVKMRRRRAGMSHG